MSRAEVVSRVADALVAIPVEHPLRVAIDGITAIGKTTFARELAAAIEARGRPCVRVSMDGFHRPRAARYRQGRDSADGYYEDAYDFDALRNVLLDPLGPKGSGSYRTAVIDLATDRAVSDAAVSAVPGLVVVVDGSFLQRREVRDGWDAVVFLRASFATVAARGAARDADSIGSLGEAQRLYAVRYHAAQQRYLDEHHPESSADIVIDAEDPADPEILRVSDDLHLAPYLRNTRRFFGPRASGWNDHFHDDGPAYAAAAAELAPRPGGTVVDVGCGSGRALVPLRDAIGLDGTVVGVDATTEMLRAARDHAAGAKARLVLGDVTCLPLASGSVDAVFAAGLLSHVPDVHELLVQLAALVTPEGRLAVFHPIGREALARRHQRELRSDELLDPSVLPGVLAAAGWSTERIDDADDRYLALAIRRSAGR